MKLNAKKGTLILGTVVNYDNGIIAVADEMDTYEYPMTEKAAASFEKCNVKDGTFISVFVIDGKVDNFKFTGRYSLVTEFKKKDSDEKYTTRVNVFIGIAARITHFEKLVQVSMPVNKKDDTEWYNLNFYYGSDNEHPLDVGEKAALELVSAENEPKKYFWALTGAPKKYTDKKGIERETYSVRQFATFERMPK